MGILLFILIAVILILLTLFFSLREKNNCPNCHSQNISKTGNKIYKEKPAIAFYGSPVSYHQVEYKCNDCGMTFFKEQKTVILFAK